MDRAQSFIEEMASKFIPPTGSVGNKRLLMVTHGGFIGEFFNVLRKYQGKPPVYKNDAKNCAMFIIQF